MRTFFKIMSFITLLAECIVALGAAANPMSEAYSRFQDRKRKFREEEEAENPVQQHDDQDNTNVRNMHQSSTHNVQDVSYEEVKFNGTTGGTSVRL